MDEGEVNYTRLSKTTSHKLLTTILIFFSASVLLIGDFTAFKTGMYTAGYQIAFIVMYLILNSKTNSVSIVKQKSNLLITFLLILLYFTYLTSYLINMINIQSETHRIASSLRMLFISTHLFFLYTLVQFFHADKRIQSHFQIVPSIVLVIIFFILLVYQVYSSPQIQYSINNIPFATNIRHLGYIALIGSIISAVKLLRRKTKEKSNLTLWIVLLTSNLSLLFWLGGRASILAYFVGLLLYIGLLFGKNSFEKKGLLYLTMTVIVAVAISSFLSIYPWNGILRVQESLQYAGDVNQLSSNRIEMWANSIDYGLEKIWLGHGPDAYRFMPTKTAGVQPHNLFLQFFLEAGLIGLILVTVILSLSIYNTTLLLWKNVNNEVEESISLAYLVIIVITVHGMLSGTYYHSQSLYFLMMAFAAVASIAIRQQTYRNH